MSISLVKEASCVPEPSLELFNHNMEQCGKLLPSDWPVLDSHDHMVGSDIPTCYLPVSDVSSKNDYFILPRIIRLATGWSEIKNY